MRETLERLRAKSLIGETPTEPPRIFPSPPDSALGALIAEQERRLTEARLGAARLMEDFRRGAEGTSVLEFVEVVTGGKAVRQRFVALQKASKERVRVMDKPPYVADPIRNPVELEPLSEGIEYRAIYAPEALEQPSKLAVIREDMKLGSNLGYWPASL